MACASRTKPVRKRQLRYQLFLGVDGGGTKTNVALMNDAREVVAEGSAARQTRCESVSKPPLRISQRPIDAGVRRRRSIARRHRRGNARTRRRPRADIRERVERASADRFRIRKTIVITDAEIALYGTTLGKAGLVVIAGTGSVCLGINDEGENGIAGGWGPVAGDEGGGRGIAATAFTRSQRPRTDAARNRT